MSIRSITFKPEMIEALLDGRKTQTRRIIKPGKRPFEVGDFLWVREQLRGDGEPGNLRKGITRYGLDGQMAMTPVPVSIIKGNGEIVIGTVKCDHLWPWKRTILPSMYMPKVFSRITLEITQVTKAQIQDISEHDAKQEGFANVAAFEAYWDAIYKKLPEYQWINNPRVTAYAFAVHYKNIDSVQPITALERGLSDYSDEVTDEHIRRMREELGIPEPNDPRVTYTSKGW